MSLTAYFPKDRGHSDKIRNTIYRKSPQKHRAQSCDAITQQQQGGLHLAYKACISHEVLLPLKFSQLFQLQIQTSYRLETAL